MDGEWRDNGWMMDGRMEGLFIAGWKNTWMDGWIDWWRDEG